MAQLTLYTIAQLTGGILGVGAAHLMFELPIPQLSTKARAGVGQWTGGMLATFGLVLTIIGTGRCRPAWMPATVALYIVSAYWFTSSTSFANPAITVARALTDSFAGIAPGDAPAFLTGQHAGALVGAWVGERLFTS